MIPPASPPKPDPEALPAVRAAVRAYRRVLRETRDESRAHHAAVDAYHAERPELDRAEAARRATHAIAYAATHHTEWFWRGIG